jgi:hypothetical protein
VSAAAGSVVPDDRRRVLDPIERLSEALFGLVMVLAFTASMRVATGGSEDVHAMLREALGCNVAWGIVDATMYLLVTVLLRARAITLLRAVHTADDAATTRRLIADALPPLIASVAPADALESVRRGLCALPAPSRRPWIDARDVWGAVEVFALVVLATLPVAVPFIVIDRPVLALRLSQAIAITLLFAGGWALGG